MIIDLQECTQMSWIKGWFMFRIVRHLMMMLLLLGITMPAQAEETNHDIMFTDLNLNVELLDSSLWVADNRQPTSTTVVPNIPDSAFKKPSSQKMICICTLVWHLWRLAC